MKQHTPDGHKICFVSRETYPREEMLRFVAGPRNTLVFDVTGKLPGRGVWIYPLREVVQKAVAKKMFAKFLFAPVQTKPEVMEQVETGLRTRVLSLLGLARKSGVVVFGFEAVKKAMLNGGLAMAFEAEDASAREQDKLYHHAPDIFVCSCFSREELGHMMGQDKVVHIGILNERASELLVQTVRKLDLFLQGKEKG